MVTEVCVDYFPFEAHPQCHTHPDKTDMRFLLFILGDIQLAKLIAPAALVSKKAKLEHPVRVFAYSGVQAGAEIGRYTYINRHSFVHGSVKMGRYCSVARGVDIGAKAHDLNLMSTHPFQYNKLHFDNDEGYQSFERTIEVPKSETLIGNDVWFGAKAVVSSDITIGTGAVIGANSFVRTDVPPYAIVVGSPSRIVRYRFEPHIIERLLASEWWDLLPEDMAGIDFEDIEKALDEVEVRKAKIDADKAAEVEETVESDAEDSNPFIDNLRFSLDEMSVREDVVELVMPKAEQLAGQIDLLDPSDQEVMRNKLTYLRDFLDGKGDEALTSSEKTHIATLFAQKQ